MIGDRDLRFTNHESQTTKSERGAVANQTIYNESGRHALLRGVNQLADTVAITLDLRHDHSTDY